MDDNPAFAEVIRQAAGKPNAPIHPFPSPMVHLMAPFNEMREMIDRLGRPLRLIDGKLRRFLGEVPQRRLSSRCGRRYGIWNGRNGLAALHPMVDGRQLSGLGPRASGLGRADQKVR